MIVVLLGFLSRHVPDIISQHAAVFGSSAMQSVVNPVMRDPVHFLFFFVVTNLLFWVAWWPVAMDQWHRCAATASATIPTDRNFGTAGRGARAYVFLLVMAFVCILLIALAKRSAGRKRQALCSLVCGGDWCAVTFQALLSKLEVATSVGDIDATYLLLDMMFVNTVLVAIVSGIGYLGALVALRKD